MKALHESINLIPDGVSPVVTTTTTTTTTTTIVNTQRE